MSRDLLSQSDLFARFLDAKLRVNALQSTLIKDPEFPAATMEEWFTSHHYTESCCFDYDFAEQMLGELRESEDPEYELEKLVDHLENLLAGARMLHREFRALCEQARTEPPESVGDETFDESLMQNWEECPRYILPVSEQKDAA